MQHKMRRFKQMLPPEESEAILAQGSNGVLSLVDRDGAPYGVPLSYVYDTTSGSIYFHSARTGHKIDCIMACDRASFCVVALDDVKPEKFTTYFRSVIVSGRITVVDNPDEIVTSLRILADKYSPGIDSTKEIDSSLKRITVMKLKAESITGKEAIELTAERSRQSD